MAAQHAREGDYSTRYRFNGKEQDEATGFYYYGARYYEPSLSRWLSADPLAEKYQGFSPYNYTLNNPINLVDPDGMQVDILEPDTKKDTEKFNKYIGELKKQNKELYDYLQNRKEIIKVSFSKDKLLKDNGLNGLTTTEIETLGDCNPKISFDYDLDGEVIPSLLISIFDPKSGFSDDGKLGFGRGLYSYTEAKKILKPRFKNNTIHVAVSTKSPNVLKVLSHELGHAKSATMNIMSAFIWGTLVNIH